MSIINDFINTIASGIKRTRDDEEKKKKQIDENRRVFHSSEFNKPAERQIIGPQLNERDKPIEQVTQNAIDSSTNPIEKTMLGNAQIGRMIVKPASDFVKKMSEEYLYNPETKRVLPSSPLYPENNGAKQLHDNIKEYGSYSKIPQDKRKEMIDKGISTVAGIVGAPEEKSGKLLGQVENKATQAIDELPQVRRPLSTTSMGGADLPSAETARTLPLTTDTVNRVPSNKYSPSMSPGDVLGTKSFMAKYQSTIDEKPYLDTVLKDVAEDRSFTSNLKDPNTAASKILRKVKTKPEYSEDNIGDFLRGNVVARDASDAKHIVTRLEHNVNIESVDDYISNPNEWGYQGINVNIRTPGGNLAEIQIHTPSSEKVQEALHPLYEKWRDVEEVPETVFAEARKIATDVRTKYETPIETPLISKPQALDELPLTEKPPGDIPGKPGEPMSPPGNPADEIIYDQEGTGKIKKIAGDNQFEYDVKKLSTPEDVKQVILGSVREGQATGALQEQRRGTMTWTQTRQMADNLGMSTEDVMKRKPGQIWNAEQADAANRLMVKTNEELFNTNQQIRDLQKQGLPITPQLQAQQLEQAARSVGVSSSVIGDRSEAARALNAAKIFKEALDDPARQNELVQKATKMFLGDSKKATEVLKKLGAFDPEDTLGQLKFLRQVKPSTPMDKILEYWYNSVLSNTATHVVNGISNTVSTLLRIPEKIVAGGIDVAASALTGAERTRYIGEAGAELSSLSSGFGNGFRRFVRVMQHGIGEADVDKLEWGRDQAIKGVAGDIVNIPSRTLVASDELFKGINYEMDIRAQAFRTAKNEGLKDTKLVERVAELTANPSAQMMEKASENANVRLFQGDSKTADAVRHFRDNVAVLDLGKFGKLQPLRFIIPFVQTPMNVLKFGLERSPAGLLSAGYKAVSGKGQGEVADALANTFIGSAVMATAAMYFTQDKITGAAPKDPKERDAFYADGKLPWSVKIGDQWVAYNRIEPLNAILSQVAMWHDAFKKNEKAVSTATIADFLQSAGRNFADQTFMTGLGNMVDAIDDPERFGQKFITDIAGGFIPSLSGAAARATDDTVRKPEGIQEAMMSRLPLLSEKTTPFPSDYEPGGAAVRHTNDGLGRNIASNFLGFRSTQDQGLDNLDKLKEIKDIRAKDRAQSDKESQTAQEVVDALDKMPAEERPAYVEKYSDRIQTKVKSILKERKLNLTGVEADLKNSSIRTRANYMYEQLKSLTPEERRIWVKNAKEKKIVTKDVEDEFRARIQHDREQELNNLPLISP